MPVKALFLNCAKSFRKIQSIKVKYAKDITYDTLHIVCVDLTKNI